MEKQEYNILRCLTPDSEPMFGTDILGISQENLDDEVSSALGSWDAEKEIEKGKRINGQLKKGTKDMVVLIYKAKAILKDAEMKEKWGIDFADFCDKIGITVHTANRWIREWKDPEGEAEKRERAKSKAQDDVIVNNAASTINRIGMSIVNEGSDFIEVEINYLGKIFYKKLKRS